MFVPSIHGFPFANSWPRGTPVLRLGPLRIGDASGGLCGGMVFAVLDYVRHDRPRPAEPSLLFDYCRGRLLDSWHLPFGALKYYDWQRRPTLSRSVAGVTLVDGTAALSAAIEWPKVQLALDAGSVTPLGLVIAAGYDPRRMGRHHQVLATNYRVENESVAIAIYDPNWPDQDDLTLTLRLDGPAMIVHSLEGPIVRGLFLNDYTPADPKLS